MICRENDCFSLLLLRLDLTRNSLTLYHSATSLSFDKYERKRMTIQLRESVMSQEKESDVTVQLRRNVLYNQKKRNRCVTIQLRRSVLFSYQEQMWQYSFEEVYCTITIAMSLLQWRIFSEFATMTWRHIEQYNFEKAYSQYVTIRNQIVSLRRSVLYSHEYV